MTTLFAGLALLMFVVSVPLAAQKIPPNRLYGFRTPRTVKDERVWYPTNKIAGRNGIVFAMVLAAAAAMSFLGILGGWLIPAVALVFFAGLISTFVSASNVVNAVDKGGPLIDYSSSLSHKRDKSKDGSSREKLLKKLDRER